MQVAAAATIATAAASVFYSKKSADAQKKQIKSANAAAQKEYELNRQQAQLTLAETQRKNRNLLAQQQSAYKAKLGASGMSSKNGSGEVVLNTMQKEHDTEDKYLVDQANISLEALVNGINQTKSRNLLSLQTIDNNSRSNLIGSLNSFGRSVIK